MSVIYWNLSLGKLNFFQETQKHIYIFIIAQHLVGADSWNFFSMKTRTYLYCNMDDTGWFKMGISCYGIILAIPEYYGFIGRSFNSLYTISMS